MFTKATACQYEPLDPVDPQALRLAEVVHQPTRGRHQDVHALAQPGQCGWGFFISEAEPYPEDTGNIFVAAKQQLPAYHCCKIFFPSKCR